MSTLAVSEVFGPTFQGEGPSAGRLAWFLRLGGCNLSCSWCDTSYTWDASRYDLRAEITRLAVAEILAQLPDRAELLIITGGEPLLQAGALEDLIYELPAGMLIEIETNGTLPPPAWHALVTFNVSPKLAHSGRATDLAPGWLSTPTAWYKFVVTDLSDLDEVARYGTPDERTWIMPEGTDAAKIMRRGAELADFVLDRGWNLTLRQHVLLWGSERGR